MGVSNKRAGKAGAASSSAPDRFGYEWTIAPRLMHMFRAQEKILGAYMSLAQRCLDRQNKMTSKAIAATRSMQESPGDIHALQAMLSELPRQYLEKTTEDVADWMAFCRECADRLTTEEIEAEAEIMGLTEEAAAKQKLPTRIPV